MSNVKINSELLNAEIEKLENVGKDIENLIANIRKENENLKEYWNTRTSEGVFTDFTVFYDILNDVKDTNDRDIDFLKNTVSDNYVNYEEKTDTLVDSNISI